DVAAPRPGRRDARRPAAAAPHGDRRRGGGAARPGAGGIALIGAALIVLALLGIWEVYVDVSGLNSLILPAPHAIGRALGDDRWLLLSYRVGGAGDIVCGLTVALATGLVLAVALHRFRTVRGSVYPLLVSSQTIPIPVIAPLLVFWLGFGLAPKVFI